MRPNSTATSVGRQGSNARLQSPRLADPCPTPPSTPTPAAPIADDRIARPGRARHRAHRRQGGLRRGRAARRTRGDHDAEAQADVRHRARRCRSCARAPRASRRAARISASAAAARCSTSTPARRSPPSSARSRTRCGISARVRAELLLPPIHGPAWGYRHRARLSVRHVAKKGGVLVGFHERKSSYVADMTSCAILPPQDLGRCCRSCAR